MLNQVVSGPLSKVSCLNAPGRLTLLPTNRADPVFPTKHHVQSTQEQIGVDQLRKLSTIRAAAIILVAAFASFILSVTLWFSGNELQGIYVGIWVPSILSFGAVALQLRGKGHE